LLIVGPPRPAGRKIDVTNYGRAPSCRLTEGSCLWWVPAGHRPTVAEGRERLTHYQEQGATPYAFWFSQRFSAPVAEALVPA